MLTLPWQCHYERGDCQERNAEYEADLRLTESIAQNLSATYGGEAMVKGLRWIELTMDEAVARAMANDPRIYGITREFKPDIVSAIGYTEHCSGDPTRDQIAAKNKENTPP